MRDLTISELDEQLAVQLPARELMCCANQCHPCGGCPPPPPPQCHGPWGAPPVQIQMPTASASAAAAASASAGSGSSAAAAAAAAAA